MILLANNASSVLDAAISPGDVTLSIASGDAALFPQPTLTGDYFPLVIEDRRLVPNVREVVICTARSGAVCTITRAQEGTVARGFFVGAVVSLRLTAGSMYALQAEETALRSAADALEATNRSAAILAETNRALAAEAAEANTRATAITNEQNTRAAADTAEANARVAADNAETTARIAAISAEVTARNFAIAAEATRATASETGLYTVLAATNAGVTGTAAGLAAEISRAVTAEAALAAGMAGVRGGVGTVVIGIGSTSIPFTPRFPTTLETVLINITSPFVSPGATITIIASSVTGFAVTADNGGLGFSLTLSFSWVAVGT